MGKYTVKQLIIIRKDLCMNKGKLAAQAAHASMGAIIPKGSVTPDGLQLNLVDKPEVVEWFNTSFAKVVLAVYSEEELLSCYNLAKDNNLLTSYIVDDGTTVFNGVKTPTCIGVGPTYSEILDNLFGDLRLY